MKEWIKSKPYWLKGGIIGTVFALIAELIFWFSNGILSDIFSAVGLIPYYFLEIFGETGKNLGYAILDSSYLCFVYVFGFYFIAGGILGWVGGKIKRSSGKLKVFYAPLAITIIHFLLVLSADTLFHPTNTATLFFAPLLIFCLMACSSFVYYTLLFLSELLVFILAFVVIYLFRKHKIRSQSQTP